MKPSALKMVVVGSASGMPCEERSSSCYWLESGDKALLLDCGDGASRALLSARLEPLKIGAVAITHSHSDHWTGLPLLIQMFHLLKRRQPLQLFTPPAMTKVLKQTLEMSFMWAERIGFEIIWQSIEHGQSVNFGPFSITPHQNSHLRGYQKDHFRHPLSALTSFSLAIKCNRKLGVYSGDIGELADLNGITNEPIDWLLLEGMHFSMDDFNDWISNKSIGRIIITHIPPEREGKVFEKATIAKDGMVLEL